MAPAAGIGWKSLFWDCGMGHRNPLMLRWFSSTWVCWDARCSASSFPFSTCSHPKFSALAEGV